MQIQSLGKLRDACSESVPAFQRSTNSGKESGIGFSLACCLILADRAAHVNT
jgi:hypothetical protein